MASPPQYLSGTSANALISDLRPTTVAPQALSHINLLLDEIVSSLILSAESLNPKDLRTAGVPAVFNGDKAADSGGPRALGRAAVGEAELELRSWYESQGGIGKGFGPGGLGGNGMKAAKAFAKQEAIEVMRVKTATLCTLASEDAVSKTWEDQALAAWRNAGGDASAATLGPAGLWLTAIIEHVCEHILSSMSRVVARDSSTAVAGIQDLYTALCEDEMIWGLFRRMAVKELLESAAQVGIRQKKTHPSGIDSNGRSSPAHNGSAYGSRVSLALPTGTGDTVKRGASPAGYGDLSARGSFENARLGPVSASMNRSTSALRNSSNGGERSPSVLSAGTKSMIGAAYEELEDDEDRSTARDRQQEAEDEFDALVRSGQTMKVSLTPSRLKTFESARRPIPEDSASSTLSPEAKRDKRYTDVQQNAIGSTGLRTPPRSGVRPEIGARTRSASSAQKMAARGAATIQEAEDEEDGASPTDKMESLRDVFTAGPQQQSPSGRRMVPAVVLSTPPPPPPSSSKPQTPLQTPDMSSPRGTLGGTNRNEAEIVAPQPKRRTEAQEMADFFSSTGPSGDSDSVRSQPQDDGASTAKPKGLKGFMAKMTGKSSKPDHTTLASSSLKHKISTPSMPLQAVSGTSAMPLGAPITATGGNTLPPMPPVKNASRSQADSQVPSGLAGIAVTGTAMATAAGAVAGSSGMPGIRRSESLSRARKPAPKYSEADDASSSSTPAAPTVDGSIDSVPETAAQRLAMSSAEPARDTILDSVPEAAAVREAAAMSGDGQTGQAVSSASVSATATDALSPTNTERSHDGDSFATADESIASPTYPLHEAAEPVGAEGRPRGSVSTIVASPTSGDRAGPAAPAADQTPHSMPVDRLVPLHTLLQHASTADECRLLLNAFVKQLDIPVSSTHPAPVDSEDKAAAWLLAGADGSPAN